MTSLSAIAARLQNLRPGRRRAFGPRPYVEVRAAEQLGTLTGMAESEMRDVLRTALGGDPGLDAAVIRAVAGGASPYLVRQLADAWTTWSAPARADVAAPLAADDGRLTWAGEPATQIDQTACGHAVLVSLAASGDPFLAAWLATGAVFSGYLPPELRPLGPEELAEPDPRARFALAQRGVGLRTRTKAVGPIRWPAAFGTPPWTAAREARWLDLDFQVRHVAKPNVRVTLHHVVAHLDAGIPVVMYTGGDLAHGVTTALPRHVVLAVGHDGGTVRIYEPSDARIHEVDLLTLANPAGPLPAFGNWRNLAAVLLA